MKLKNIKTCNGCKALNMLITLDCLLLFETEKTHKYKIWKFAHEDVCVDIKPKDKCPKPRTGKEYLKAFDMFYSKNVENWKNAMKKAT